MQLSVLQKMSKHRTGGNRKPEEFPKTRPDVSNENSQKTCQNWSPCGMQSQAKSFTRIFKDKLNMYFFSRFSCRYNIHFLGGRGVPHADKWTNITDSQTCGTLRRSGTQKILTSLFQKPHNSNKNPGQNPRDALVDGNARLSSATDDSVKNQTRDATYSYYY